MGRNGKALRDVRQSGLDGHVPGAAHPRLEILQESGVNGVRQKGQGTKNTHQGAKGPRKSAKGPCQGSKNSNQGTKIPCQSANGPRQGTKIPCQGASGPRQGPKGPSDVRRQKATLLRQAARERQGRHQAVQAGKFPEKLPGFVWPLLTEVTR